MFWAEIYCNELYSGILADGLKRTKDDLLDQVFPTRDGLLDQVCLIKACRTNLTESIWPGLETAIGLSFLTRDWMSPSCKNWSCLTLPHRAYLTYQSQSQLSWILLIRARAYTLNGLTYQDQSLLSWVLLARAYLPAWGLLVRARAYFLSQNLFNQAFLPRARSCLTKTFCQVPEPV